MAMETQQETPRRRSRSPSTAEPELIELHGGELYWGNERK
jgi:hypothetical protein